MANEKVHIGFRGEWNGRPVTDIRPFGTAHCGVKRATVTLLKKNATCKRCLKM